MYGVYKIKTVQKLSKCMILVIPKYLNMWLLILLFEIPTETSIILKSNHITQTYSILFIYSYLYFFLADLSAQKAATTIIAMTTIHVGITITSKAEEHNSKPKWTLRSSHSHTSTINKNKRAEVSFGLNIKGKVLRQNSYLVVIAKRVFASCRNNWKQK